MASKEQKKTVVERALEKAAASVDWFNPYDRRHCIGFLVVVGAIATAAGYYGLKSEKKEEKKK